MLEHVGSGPFSILRFVDINKIKQQQSLIMLNSLRSNNIPKVCGLLSGLACTKTRDHGTAS